jgi:hypothetical protein
MPFYTRLRLGMLAAGGFSTFANLAEVASLPSFLGSQSYLDRYLWRTTVTWDLKW